MIRGTRAYNTAVSSLTDGKSPALTCLTHGSPNNCTDDNHQAQVRTIRAYLQTDIRAAALLYACHTWTLNHYRYEQIDASGNKCIHITRDNTGVTACRIYLNIVLVPIFSPVLLLAVTLNAGATLERLRVESVLTSPCLLFSP